MKFPVFPIDQDPGSNFGELLKRVGLSPFADYANVSQLDIPHATTCVAVRCAGGVVMVGKSHQSSNHGKGCSGR